MIRSPVAGASVVRFGKVWVELAVVVVVARSVFAATVGTVGNDTVTLRPVRSTPS
jgi:hypothetical protein